MKYKIVLIGLIFIFTINLYGIVAGEELTFSLRYEFIHAGIAKLSFNKSTYQNDRTKEIRSVYVIKSKAKTNNVFDLIHKVRDELVSTWDAQELISLKFSKKLNEGFYKQNRTIWYYPDIDSLKYQSYSFKQKRYNDSIFMPIEKETQDILSAFYFTRLQDLSVGDELFINIAVDKKTYIAKVIVHKKEKKKTIFGKKECLVIEPILAGDAIFKQTGKIKIWVTNDEQKIPVLLKSKFIIGSFRAVLVRAENVEEK